MLRKSDVDLVRTQDVGLRGADDPEVPAWAAEQGRIVLTHSRSTMPDYALRRVAADQPMPGVFVLDDRFPVGGATDEILWLVDCSEHDEWKNPSPTAPNIHQPRMFMRYRVRRISRYYRLPRRRVNPHR